MVTQAEVWQAIQAIITPELIAKAAEIDGMPNQIQIHGKTTVNKIALGVSCSQGFIDSAVKKGADYLIVHHGLTGVAKGRFDVIEDRLKSLITNDLTLAGFHYCLDVHPIIGNNVQLIEKLGARKTDESYYSGWGWVAEYETPITLDELIHRVETMTGHPVFAVKTGPAEIKRIGVCSGGARPHDQDLLEIIDKHIDVHLTGEISESAPYDAQGIGFNYLACGHYATETFGIKALGEQLKAKLPAVDIEFIAQDVSL